MAKIEPSNTPQGRCFFITPIGAAESLERKRADWVFKLILKSVCELHRLTLQRSDQMEGSPMITTRIFGALQNAEICVADLTTLNANVFYELGIRHSFQKPVMHIAQEGTLLPFDTAQHDTFFYDLSTYGSMIGMASWLSRQFSLALDPNTVVSNPLTSALGSLEMRASADTKDQVVADLLGRVEKIESTERVGAEKYWMNVVSPSFNQMTESRLIESNKCLVEYIDRFSRERELVDAGNKLASAIRYGDALHVKSLYALMVPCNASGKFDRFIDAAGRRIRAK